MNSCLAAKKSSFCVANLGNSWLFAAIDVLNLNLSLTIYFVQSKSEAPERLFTLPACAALIGCLELPSRFGLYMARG